MENLSLSNEPKREIYFNKENIFGGCLGKFIKIDLLG